MQGPAQVTQPASRCRTRSPCCWPGLWPLKHLRSALMGTLLSVEVGQVGGTGHWEGEANWGTISSPPEIFPWRRACAGSLHPSSATSWLCAQSQGESVS